MKKNGKSIFKAFGSRLSKFFFMFGVITFALLMTSYYGAIARADVDQSLLEVTTKYGKIKGFEDDHNTLAWKGIPYAKPPLGDLRWKAPQDPDTWEGLKETVDDCDECVQWKMTRTWQQLNELIGNEDCLYLNIWRPQSSEKKLPVFVWIHGGSNKWGSAQAYQASALASSANMIVVVIQYRLGPFGWFTNPALRTGDIKSDSGNFGTLDTIKALEWVRHNIKAFGGDSHNITVGGESAGAHNVMNLLISPLSKNLFHRAVSMSNAMLTISVEDGETSSNIVINALLLADPEISWEQWLAMSPEAQKNYLRGKSPYEIMIAAIPPQSSMLPISAYEDGTVIPDNLLSIIDSGKYNKVPLILGSNEYEIKAFLPFFGPMIKYIDQNIPSGDYTWAQLFDVLNDPNHKNPSLDDVLPTQFDKDLYHAFGYFGSRSWKAKYVDSIARQLAEHQDNVYAYLFKWGGIGSGPTPFNFIFGPAHGMELPFFGGMDESLFGYSFTEENRLGREELQEAMMAYLARFAWTGNPNEPCSEHLKWKEWSNAIDKPKCIEFNADFNHAILNMSSDELTELSVRVDELNGWLYSPPFDYRKLMVNFFLDYFFGPI